jgi:hypothetical protein
MHRSSESVADLASALAKAQAELVNPEKSLTGTIHTGQSRERERTFRYAPLSSGLDIVRKTLGRHEIATVQTTAIDPTAGIINLTTLLAHSSGQWIASDWPVCPVAEMGSPQRMGAALTYARRYALFTLVGIAGEDDLDAPDLCEGAPSSSSAVDRLPNPNDGQSRVPPRRPGNGHVRSVPMGRAAVLDPEQSAAVRERLLTEVCNIGSADLAASWARTALSVKNSLTGTDAKLVEDAFEKRVSEFSHAEMQEEPLATAIAITEKAITPQVSPTAGSGNDQADGIDKSVLAIAEPRRYRNRAHLRFVAQQACLVCGRKPSDPHHLGFTQPRALGRKVSDEFAVPLCRGHHRAVHRSRDERAWWKQTGIDPMKIACKLWKQSRHTGRRIRIGNSYRAYRAEGKIA